MFSIKNRGFTLVELAIVLVIIGLLIGGILVAQSMIDTARINSVIRSIQQYDVAVSNFQTKYNGLPGDSTALGCTAVINICGNNIIEDKDAGYPGVTYQYSGEIKNFWPNLQQGGFTAPNGSILVNTISGVFKTQGANINSPKLVYNHAGILPISMDAVFYPSIFFSDHNYYVVCDFETSTYAITTTNTSPVHNHIINACSMNGAIPVVAALAIDAKIDDGLSDGNNDLALDNLNVIDITDSCSDPASYDKYNISNPNAKCGLFFRMLSQTSNSQ